MVEKLKHTLVNNPKAALLAVVVILLLAIALYMNIGFLPDIWPGEIRIEQRLSELKDLQGKLRRELDRERNLSEIIANSSADSTLFWIALRDGDPKQAMRKIVENAATKVELKLTALGALRTSKLDGGLIAYEMNLSALTDLELLLKFLRELDNSKPKLHWSQFSFRPDNTRMPKNVYFSGTIKAVAIESEKFISMLEVKTP